MRFAWTTLRLNTENLVLLNFIVCLFDYRNLHGKFEVQLFYFMLFFACIFGGCIVRGLDRMVVCFRDFCLCFGKAILALGANLRHV